MAIDYNALAKQAGAIQSTSPAGNTVNYDQLAQQAGAIQPQTPAQPEVTIGSAGQSLVPGSTLGSNLKALPGQALQAVKNVGNFFTGSEQGLGNNIGDIINAPQAQVQASNTAHIDAEYLKTLIQLKRKAILEGNSANAQHYDTLIQNHQPTTYQAPSLPSTGEVAGNLLGTAADVLSIGTYGKATAGMKTGELGKAIPSAITLGQKGVQAGQQVVQNVGTSMAENTAKKETAKIIDIVAPKLTPVKGAKILTTGVGEAPGLLKKASVDFSTNPSIQRAAEAVKGLVKPGASYIENTNNVYKGIKDISENTVKPFLSSNPVPFNFQDLRKSFELISPKSSLKADGEAYQTYNRVRESLLNDVYHQLNKSGNKLSSTDFNELWDARKVIDSKIQDELGGKVFGTPQYAGVKAAARDFRNGLNKFITDSLANPGNVERVNQFTDFLKTARSKGIDIANEGDAYKALESRFGINQSEADVAKAAFFRDSLDKMSSMYEAVGNMAPKAYQELGKNKYELWLKAHPLLSKAVGGAATAAGFGAVYEGGKLVGE